jgi:thioredoxin reductase (NADPH)
VVGGGNSAGQAALHFANFARKVFMVIRGDGLKETVSQYLIDRIKSSPKIEVLTHTEVTELLGDSMLEAITLTNNPDYGEADGEDDQPVSVSWRRAQYALGG